MANKKTQISIVFILFISLGLIYTFPLILHFTDGLPYSRYAPEGYQVVPLCQGDHLQLYYHLWLLKDAVRGNISFFTNPYEFSTDESTQPFSKQGIPLSAIFVILSIFGNVFAYNSLIILSFALSGISVYLLVHLYTKDKLSSFIAGVIFALAPFRIAQLLGGHINGFMCFLVPLTIYFCEAAFTPPFLERAGFIKRKIRYSTLAGLCIFLLTLAELHLIYYLLLFMTIYLPVRIILTYYSGYKPSRLLRILLPLFVFILLSVGTVFYLKFKLLDVSIAAAGRPFSQIRLFSPKITDIFRRTNSISEKYIYLGVIPVFLAMFGCFYNIIKKNPSHPSPPPKGERANLGKVVTVFYGMALVISYALSLGPSLEPLFPLYRFCYKFLPYFNFPRIPARMVVISFMAIAVLAGFGFSYVRNLAADYSSRLGGIKKKICLAIPPILLLAILIDYLPATPPAICLTDRENNIYRIIRENVGDHKVLELPIWPGDSAWSSIYQYYVTTTGAKMLNGYSPAVPSSYIDDVFHPLYNVNLGEIRNHQYQLLKGFNVKYIIMHQEAFPVKVSPYPSDFSINNLKSSPYLRFIKHQGPIWLFELLDKPHLGHLPQEFVQTSVIGKLYEAERLRRKTGTIEADSDTSDGYAVYGDVIKHKKGHLTFGPWRKFPTGKYKVLFRLKVNDNSNNKVGATIELTADKGQTILVKKDIPCSNFYSSNIYQDFILSYQLKEPQRLEFKVYFHKVTDLWVDYVYVLFANQKDPLLSIEAEPLFHIARVESDPDASYSLAIHTDTSKDPPNHLLSGPYRRYPKGNYTASFRLKIDEITNEEVCLIGVSTDNRKRSLETRSIRGTDFKGKDTYQEFKISYSLQRPTILEFLVRSSNTVNLWVDKIEVTKEHL